MKYFKLCVNVDFEVLIKLNRADEMLFRAKKLSNRQKCGLNRVD